MKKEMTPEQRKEKRNTILIAAAVILAAACIIGLVVYNNVSDSGFFLRKSVAAQSENYEVNGAMMTYFFWTNYDQYASIAETYMGLNTSASLKTQVMDQESGTTWFDYFAAMAENYVGELLTLCECAKADGIQLEETDEAYVNDSIASMTATASQYGYDLDTYLRASFGAGVRESDVRDCLELSVLASKYYNQYMDSLEYTDADYDAYYEANKDSFQAVDYISCTIKQDQFIAKDADGNPVGSVTEAATAAKAYADSIAAASSEAEFRDAILKYYTDVNGLSAEEAQTKLEACIVEGMTPSVGTEASDWAFGAKAGETKVVSASGGTAYEVYYLTKEAYRDDTPTRDVRHILLSNDTYGAKAENKAAEVYAKWEESGFDMTVFETLVTEYTEDPGSLSTGGLYENVSQGQMVAEFDAWLFDAARQEGDTGMVNTSYGCHIMYFAGEGLPAWKVAAEEALMTEAYSAMITEKGEGITFDQEVVYSINA